MFKASVDAVAWGQPPHNLLPGNDAFDGAMARLDDLRQVFTASEAVVRGAAFPQHSVITRMPQAAG